MELKELIAEIKNQIDHPMEGLPEEVFLFITEMTPMVNVDLIIRDDKERVLLSWRDDEFCGQGWHIPGGIIRLKETFEERIQKTALKEIGCKVEYIDKPVEIVPIIYKQQETRGHFITFVYECKIPNGKKINNGGRKQGDAGYLAWHENYPVNMIPVHAFYKKYFRTKEKEDGIDK